MPKKKIVKKPTKKTAGYGSKAVKGVRNLSKKKRGKA